MILRKVLCFLLVLTASAIAIIGAFQQEASATVYPRLALRTGWLNRWVTELDSVDFLSRFELIYTAMSYDQVFQVLDSLDAHSLDHPDFVHTFMPLCVYKTSAWEDPQNPGYLQNWVYNAAKRDWNHLVAVAVYHNLQNSVSWLLHDADGDTMCVWGGGSHPCNWMLLNHSPWCPLGEWDGIVTKDATTWRFGSTVGMTVTEWTCSVARDSLFVDNDDFTDAFFGVHTEDGLGRTTACWGAYKPGGGQHADPDPKNDGIGIPCDAYNPWPSYADSVRPSVDSLFTEFLQVLRDSAGLGIMMTGHDLRWFLDPSCGWCVEDTMMTNTYMGGKLEDFGKWSGWPLQDSTHGYWFAVYEGMETIYHPLGIDAQEGWDFSIIESNPFADDGVSTDWPIWKRDKWTRLNLGICLMGDGYFDGQAYKEDPEFYAFLGGDTTYAPFRIPEMDFVFAGAVNGYGVYRPLGQLRSLYYRKFYKCSDETLEPFTVVVNMWPDACGGVHARDAHWYRGWHTTFPQPDSLLIFDHWSDDGPVCTRNPGSSLARAVPGRSEDDGVRIDFRLEQSGTVRLTVHDVSGRLVRVLMDEQRPSGEHSAVWDQKDASRQRVNRGVYFWKLHVQDATETGRIVLLR